MANVTGNNGVMHGGSMVWVRCGFSHQKGAAMLPEDPVMLMSMINMKLRDSGESLEELCFELDTDPDEIKEKLKAAGYEFNEGINQFR